MEGKRGKRGVTSTGEKKSSSKARLFTRIEINQRPRRGCEQKKKPITERTLKEIGQKQYFRFSILRQNSSPTSKKIGCKPKPIFIMIRSGAYCSCIRGGPTSQAYLETQVIGSAFAENGKPLEGAGRRGPPTAARRRTFRRRTTHLCFPGRVQTLL